VRWLVDGYHRCDHKRTHPGSADAAKRSSHSLRRSLLARRGGLAVMALSSVDAKGLFENIPSTSGPCIPTVELWTTFA
jgi:hypothetical protein